MTKPKKPQSPKTRIADAMYACTDLRQHKAAGYLLSYIIHRANSRSLFCWESQAKLAAVASCSIRQVQKLLAFLEDVVGAIASSRFSDLSPSEKREIVSLNPKVNGKSTVYAVRLDWAERLLAALPQALPVKLSKDCGIPDEARRRGRDKINDAKRRRPPGDPPIPENFISDHNYDEWQFLNALGSVSRTSGSPIEMGDTRTSATDRYNDISGAEFGGGDRALEAAVFRPSFSEANQLQTSISSLPDQPSEAVPHGDGGGVAGACDPRPQALAGPEGTEYDAAHARANERRAS